MIDQGEMFEIANPCRGVCEVNNKGYCKGCLRKREERFHWNEFTPFQKQLIVNLCGRRRTKAIAARELAEWQAKHGSPEQEVEIPQLDMFVSDDSKQDVASATADVEASQQSANDEQAAPGEKNAAPIQSQKEAEDSSPLPDNVTPLTTAPVSAAPVSATAASLFDNESDSKPSADGKKETAKATKESQQAATAAKRKTRKSPATSQPESADQQQGPDQFDLF